MKTELVTLKNGEVLKQSEVQYSQIQGELPRFLNVAVGCEGKNDWYVQTSDILEYTNLSASIKEGMKSFFEANELAENISKITGMDIELWNTDDNVVEMLHAHNFYNELSVTLEDEGEANPSSSARVYGVFRRDDSDTEKMLQAYFGKDYKVNNYEAHECHRGEEYSMYEFIIYFRGLLPTEIYTALNKMLVLKNHFECMSNDYSKAANLMERLERAAYMFG